MPAIRPPMVSLFVCSLFTALPAAAQVDARLFQFPDVSADRIAFVYADDVWIVPKEGGLAQRLTSAPGQELFPRFSPDGSRIAFSGNYDGNTDVYVIPTTGGLPTRITYHPVAELVVDWDPDGGSLLFASNEKSGRNVFHQFYRVPSSGGLATRLPLEFAEFGALSPDGSTLAFMTQQRDTRTWKRYRGGRAPDIYSFDLASQVSENLTNDPANDGWPMWYGERMYFLSDRGPHQRFNIWAREPSGDVRQVTDFDDFDITWPSGGPSEIVFQAGGRLHLLDLATESTREVEVRVLTDLASIKPRIVNVSDWIMGDGFGDAGWPEPPAYGLSATGQRAVFEARGDIFTVPAEHGPVRNLTASSGVADRHPSWSPDGRWIAWWSDGSGEYELMVQAADGTGEPRQLTRLGKGFRYVAQWSPDSERVAFVDQAAVLRIVEVESGRVTTADQVEGWVGHPEMVDFALSWSPDGRWIAYSDTDGLDGAIRLYDTQRDEVHQVTSGFYRDYEPTFDPGGDYLYFFTDRSLAPVYGDIDATWVYPNTTQIAAVSLRHDVPSPLAPRSDEEPSGSDETAAGDADGASQGAVTAVDIDLDDFERRLVVLPVPRGNYSDLMGARGKVVYRRGVRTGAAGGDTPVVYWDLGEREEKTVIDDADDVVLSADGEHLLIRNGARFGIVALAAGQSIATPLRTAEMTAVVDPRAEWRQIFVDAWRLERDYFYDENMHGVDWPAIRDQYLPLIDHAVTRGDVNVVVGEMIAELNASHTYRGGGDLDDEPVRSVGLLGVDWTLENGAYRIAHIVRGAPWDNEVRSPLDQPGIDVAEGDFVLEVNGAPLDPTLPPTAALQGLAGQTVTLTVADAADGTGRRRVLVEPLASEVRLRNLEWIERNRQMVDDLSGGRVGYVYVPNTGVDGQTELVRQFTAQRNKEALLIDERFNTGGQIPDRFVELLNRPTLAWARTRNSTGVTMPFVTHTGPKAMLMNGWSGSGGDAFPWFFREAGLGPLIGTRTWGGLIGFGPIPQIVDGGLVSAPGFRLYRNDGHWFAEGHGVDPDIEVLEDVTALAQGRDPQIERGVEELLKALGDDRIVAPEVPAPEDRSRNGGGR